jgi:iron complex outermembrane recepter protein
MKHGVSLAVLAGLGFFAATASTTTLAAESTTTASATGSSESLQEVVVTARRKEEALEDVPQTISAVTPAEIQKLNLQNLQDLSGVVPGLQITTVGGAFNNNDTLRGVTFTPEAGTQNTVAFYVNDVPVSNNLVSTSNFDIGQIEVLSGPQGTLRGEPAPSGSLTIATRKPDLESFGGYGTITAATHSNFNENGAVNLPLVTDKLAVRLAGVANDDEYNDVHSLFNPDSPYNHDYGGRVSIRFEPTDSIQANLVYQHMFQHQLYFDQVEGPGAPGGVNPNAPAGYNGPPITAAERLAVETYPNNEYTTTDVITGSLDWHVAGQILSYVGGWYRYDINNTDATDTAHQVPGITATNPIPREAYQFTTPSTGQYSQSDEFRVSSETPLFGFMDYTAGFLYHEIRNEVTVGQLASFLPGSFGSPLAPSTPNIYNPNYTLNLVIDSPSQSKEYSEFLHLTFHLSDTTELALGGRFLHFQNFGETSGTLLTGGTSIASPLPVPCSFIGLASTYPGTCDIPASAAITNTTALPATSLNQNDHTVIYNISLSHKFADNFLAYVESGSSWRPPATAVGITNATDDPLLESLLHVKPEKSYDFEAGVKWTFLDKRGHVNADVYHQQFDHFIYFGLPTLYLANNGATTSVSSFNFTSNPNATINGVDFDAGFQITPQWSVDLAGSYSNGHLTGANIPCNPPNGGTTTAAFPAGTYVFECPGHASTSTQPDFNASLQSEYDFPVINNVNAFLRGLYVYYGNNSHASEFYTTPAYGIFNLYTGVRSSNGAWEAALFSKNLFNTERLLNLGYPTASPGGGGAALNQVFGTSGYYLVGNNQIGMTPLRQFGITVTYSFGSR